MIAAAQLGGIEALAKGGTAKPPGGGGGGGGGGAVVSTPQLNVLPPAGPPLPAIASTGVGFSVIGHIQAATVDNGCASGSPTDGGTALVNGIKIRIPTNTIVQYPANTFTWRDAICPAQAGAVPIVLDGTGGNGGPATALPSTELDFVGNIINGEYIAALVHISQQSVHTGSGTISFIDLADGSIYVRSGGAAGAPGAGEVRLVINDPNGRFGRAATTTDARFSVDDANPTIKTGATGYPMCVPRSANDPLCPAKNRPIQNATGTGCRSFTQAGLVPVGGDITITPPGLPCRAFVMKAIAGMPGAAAAGAANTAALTAGQTAASEPDARQQAPLMVGDFITWAGTLVRGGNTPAANAAHPTTNGDLIWAHTIDANVGIYTQPKTLPAYIAIGEFGIGVNPDPANAAVVPGIEATARIFLEAGVSDIASIVDIYLDDKRPDGTEEYRWVTMETMTGTLTDQAGARIPFATSAQPFGGGIQTQYTGPQPGRARIRATKVPAINPALGACPPTAGSQACAVTQSPTRYLRAVIRSLCAPLSAAGNLDNAAFVDINGGKFDVNGNRVANPAVVAVPQLPGSGPGTSGVSPDTSCLGRAQFANGLLTGQYMAPVGEYIFPENTLAGAPIIPNNFWQMDFLVRGEGGLPGGSSGPQVPQPW